MSAGWWMGRGPGGKEKATQLAKNGKTGTKDNGDEPTKNAKPMIEKPIDGWNFQDIQDHLADQGFKTSRGQGKRGMWFEPGDGKPLGLGTVEAADLVGLNYWGLYRDLSEKDKLLLKTAYEEYDAAELAWRKNSQNAEIGKRFREACDHLDPLRQEIDKRSPASLYQPFLANDHNSPDAAKKEAA